MLQNDFDLANQAFSKAQSTDPEYAQAWVGQGLLALLLGELKDAQELFEHAFQISTGNCVSVLYQFCMLKLTIVCSRL